MTAKSIRRSRPTTPSTGPDSNEDIGTDIYATTHYDHLVRAYEAGVSEATLEEIGRVSAEGMVDARLARPENDNERNSQLTADIYDTAFLMLARDQIDVHDAVPAWCGRI